MHSPVPNLFLFRKVLIREHLGERGGKGAPIAEREQRRGGKGEDEREEGSGNSRARVVTAKSL